MKYILAHDFGTSADKAALFTVDGAMVAKNAVSYPSRYAEDQVEQDPNDWWYAFCKNNEVLLSGYDPADVLCVSFDGTAPNCLCVDRNMRPLDSAMIWQDVRAKEEAEMLSAILPERHLQSHPGKKLSADRTLAKLLWVKHHRPEMFTHTWKVLPCVTSYIILRLTGRAVCDYGVARTTAMLEPDNSDWSDEILTWAKIDRTLLPELIDRAEIAGMVGPKPECGLTPGTPVVVGTVDYACTAVGAGIYQPGSFLLCGGTSASIDGFDLTGKRFGRATTASGGSLVWLKNQICHEEQRIALETGDDVFEVMDREIAKAPVGSGGVIFQPYLAGARSVFNDAAIKGSFVGISLSTTRAELMRSVVEGIGFNLNLILQSIRDMGIPVTHMPIVGGLGNGAVVRQIFADIMDVSFVTYTTMNESSAVGAAVLGGVALGIYPDESASKLFLHIDGITEPNPEARKRYAELMPQYHMLYQQLQTYYHAF